jgi:hypothetical protein
MNTPTVGPDPEAAQVVGRLVGPVVQLAVRQPFGAEDEGSGVGGALHLGFEELMDAGVG